MSIDNPHESDLDLWNEFEALVVQAPALEPEEMETLPAVFDYETRLTVIKKNLEYFRTEADALRASVFTLTIKDQAGSAIASEHKATAQKIVKRIDAKIKEMTQDATDYVQAVRNFAANLKAPLTEAKMEADRKIGIWAQYVRIEKEKQERAAREALAKEQAKINKTAEKKGIEPVILPEPQLPPQRTVIRSDSGTTFEVRKWKGVITDPEKVDRRYCCPDPKLIQEAIDGGSRNPDLAGVDIFEEVKMVTRTR